MEIQERQKEKIMRFSRIVYVLLRVAMIILIVVAVVELISWIWAGFGFETGTVTVGGTTMEAPLVGKLGNTSVYLPVAWNSGVDVLGLGGFFSSVTFGDFLGTVFTIVGLRVARSVFKLLKENGSPFRDDVIKSMKKLAIVLLVVGFVSGFISFIAAGIVWVFCLVFDYGRTLQNESDTTL